MQSRWDETIGAVNAYVTALKEAKTKASVSVTVFDNQEPFKVIRKDVKLKDWNPISATEVLPRGMTPLFDAIGALNQLLTLKAPKKASIIIVTDGLENASREFDKNGTKTILDNFKTTGYDVVFIGADFDAFGQSSGLGVLTGSTLNMTKGNYEQAFKSVANRSMYYEQWGSDANLGFSDEDRAMATGKTSI
jgi:hypothetical protein